MNKHLFLIENTESIQKLNRDFIPNNILQIILLNREYVFRSFLAIS